MGKQTQENDFSNAITQRVVSDVGILLREDLQWSEAKLPSQEINKENNIDYYLFKTLNSSWIPDSWYRWYYNIEQQDIDAYVVNILQLYVTGLQDINELKPGKLRFIATLQTKEDISYLNLSEAAQKMLSVVVNAYNANAASLLWLQSLKRRYEEINTWINKLKNKFKNNQTEIKQTDNSADWTIKIDSTIVAKSNLDNAISEYQKIYSWQWYERYKLNKKYGFDIKKYARAWDIYVLDQQKNNYLQLAQKNKGAVAIVDHQKKNQNNILLQETKDQQHHWEITESDESSAGLAEIRAHMSDIFSKINQYHLEDKHLTFQDQSYSMRQLYDNTQIVINRTLQELIYLSSANNSQFKKQLPATKQYWQDFQQGYTQFIKALEDKSTQDEWPHIKLLMDALLIGCNPTWKNLWDKVILKAQKMGLDTEDIKTTFEIQEETAVVTTNNQETDKVQKEDFLAVLNDIVLAQDFDFGKAILVLQAKLKEYQNKIPKSDLLAHEEAEYASQYLTTCAEKYAANKLNFIAYCAPDHHQNKGELTAKISDKFIKLIIQNKALRAEVNNSEINDASNAFKTRLNEIRTAVRSMEEAENTLPSELSIRRDIKKELLDLANDFCVFIDGQNYSDEISAAQKLMFKLDCAVLSEKFRSHEKYTHLHAKINKNQDGIDQLEIQLNETTETDEKLTVRVANAAQKMDQSVKPIKELYNSLNDVQNSVDELQKKIDSCRQWQNTLQQPVKQISPVPFQQSTVPMQQSTVLSPC